MCCNVYINYWCVILIGGGDSRFHVLGRRECSRGARSILDLYTVYNIGPPRCLCVAMMCRLVWPTGAYMAAPLVNSIISFRKHPCSNVIQISSGCRRPIIDTASTRFVYQMAVGRGLHPTRGEAQQVRLRQTPENDIRKLEI